MSGSTQTLQADLCYVKRCSCVVFSLKAWRKDKQAQKSTPTPPPPSPSVPPNDVKRILAVFLPCSTGSPYLIYQSSAFFQEGGAIGRGGGGGDRTLGLFVKSFLPAFREKTTQEHLFTSHRSACEVWVDSDRLENFTRNGSNVIVARSLSIVKYHLIKRHLEIIHRSFRGSHY